MSGGTIRVLVNDQSRDFGQKFMERTAVLGWRCVMAGTQLSFIEALYDSRYDLICVSMIQPEIEGIGALQLIADSGFDGRVLMFNQSRELYARVAKNLSMMMPFDLENYCWPATEQEIEKALLRAVERVRSN